MTNCSNQTKNHDLYMNLRREYLESSHWVPVDATPAGLIIQTTNSELIRTPWVVNNFFPNHKLIYKICTQNEFQSTLDMIYGDKGANELTGEFIEENNTKYDFPNFNLNDANTIGEYDQYYLSKVEDNDIVNLVNKIVIDAYNLDASDIFVESKKGNPNVFVGIYKNGTQIKNIELPTHYHYALVTRLKIMSDLDISDHSKPQYGAIKFKLFGPLDIVINVVTTPLVDGIENVAMYILADGEPIYLAPVSRIY